MKECKACNTQKEEVEFTDQNGLHGTCNKCRGSFRKPKVVEIEKVDDNPIKVKTTQQGKKVNVPPKKVIVPVVEKPVIVPVPTEEVVVPEPFFNKPTKA